MLDLRAAECRQCTDFEKGSPPDMSIALCADVFFVSIMYNMDTILFSHTATYIISFPTATDHLSIPSAAYCCSVQALEVHTFRYILLYSFP